jgi:hypothetical protein
LSPVTQIDVVTRGDTVRFVVQFCDWEGQPADPDQVTVKIYERVLSNSVLTQVLTPEHREGVGRYHFDYTPLNDGSYFFEVVGMLDGTPATRRRPFLSMSIDE